jgi:hypothetical protein
MTGTLDTFLIITIVVTVALAFLICGYMPYKAIQKIKQQRAERKNNQKEVK